MFENILWKVVYAEPDGPYHAMLIEQNRLSGSVRRRQVKYNERIRRGDLDG